MNKFITLIVLAAVICSAYAQRSNFTNLYVASATSSPALVVIIILFT